MSIQIETRIIVAAAALCLCGITGAVAAQERSQALEPEFPSRSELAEISGSPEVMRWRKHLLKVYVQNMYEPGYEGILDDLESIMIRSGTGAINTPNEFQLPQDPSARFAATIGRGTPYIASLSTGILFSGQTDPYTASKCTLTLIDPGKILTSEHCIENSHGDIFWSYIIFEGIRQVLIDEAESFCSSAYAGPFCDPGVADLVVVPLADEYNMIPSLSTATTGNAGSGTLARIVGAGISGPLLADMGFMRMAEVLISNCAIFPPTQESLCFSFSVGQNANCSNDSGGPMIAPIASSGDFVGVAAQSSASYCGNAGEGRYVNATYTAYKQFVDDHSCGGACPAPIPATVLQSDYSLVLDATTPGHDYVISLPADVSELIVTLNHERGWTSSLNKVELSFPDSMTPTCKKFVEAEACTVTNPPSGTHSVQVNLVQGEAAIQVGIVSVP